jgi:hypothetical protein
MRRREMGRGVDYCRDPKAKGGDRKLGMGELWLAKLLSSGTRTSKSAERRIVWACLDTVLGRGPKLISMCEYGCNWSCTIELRLGVSIVLGCEYINTFLSVVVPVVDLVRMLYHMQYAECMIM